MEANLFEYGMQQTWYVDVAGDIFFDENFRPRCVKTFIIQRSIRNFLTFLSISWVYLICQHTRKVIHLWPATVFLDAISDMETRCFSGQSLQKNHSQSLFYFKIILHPVSVFLRNYFFLLTASRKKLFPKKTLQKAHEGFKISQMHRLTFHLI